jgi:predicted AAA+ superfamily ATPase
MKRDIFQELIKWKKLPERKPLILEGARQVGKTYLLKQLARESYEDSVYCNFEEDPALISLFEGKLTATHLIEQLSFYMNKKITAENTLIIFDEIQVAPRALTSLKYFNEQANEYNLIAAGSLLGVSIGQESAFPVGKVNFLHLYPLNFIEYLQAMNEEMLATLLKNKNDFSPLTPAIHEKLIHYFRIFIFIGGMPEVVENYRTNHDIQRVRDVQRNIQNAYASDFSKYATAEESLKISQIWQSIPAQLAKENKKFKFSDIKSGARYSRYELAIEWLRKAGLIYLAYDTTTAKPPLAAYINTNSFKLYYLDTGLLGARLNAAPQLITQKESLYTEYKGALIENYCAKEIKPLFQDHLHYWKSASMAEIDFLVEDSGEIFPLEVKSGLSQHKKSLTSYQEKYHPHKAFRLSPRNFDRQGNFVNLPLYAACMIKNFLSTPN